jgi:hypothetical protein
MNTHQYYLHPVAAMIDAVTCELCRQPEAVIDVELADDPLPPTPQPAANLLPFESKFAATLVIVGVALALYLCALLLFNSLASTV